MIVLLLEEDFGGGLRSEGPAPSFPGMQIANVFADAWDGES